MKKFKTKIKKTTFFLIAAGVFFVASGANFANAGTSSSTALSAVKELANSGFSEMSWTADVPANSTLSMSVRSCSVSDCSDRGSNWCPVPLSGTDISTLCAAVSDGEDYVQWKAEMTMTDAAVSSPYIDSVTINAEGKLINPLLKLISSVFDTSDKYASIGNISWISQDIGGDIKFQFRSANSEANLATASWCGPTSCNPTAGSADFYENKLTNTINETQADHADNRFVQYAAFLSSTDGTGTPILQETTVNFSYNNPPAINLISASQQSQGIELGKVKVDYTMNENAEEQTSAYPALFYQIGSVVLAQETTLSGIENIILTHAESYPIPTSGSVLIDNELITFTGKIDNSTVQTTLTGITRSTEFVLGGNYLTESSVHALNTPVYFRATSVSGDIDSSLPVNENTKSVYWDAQNELNIALNGSKWQNVTMKVAANDNDAYGNRVGGDEFNSVITIDLEKPTIISVTTSIADGKYTIGSSIPVILNFSESVNSSVPTTTLLETGDNDYNCTISSISSNASPTCSYLVQAGNSTLDLTAISVSGTIKDIFGNSMTDFSIPAGQNIADLKNIVIDTLAPDLLDVAPVSNAYIKDISSAGSVISYTTNEALSVGSQILFTRTSGNDDANSPHTCTLQGTALSEGAHTNFQLIQGANNCAEIQTNLVSGTKYTLEIAIKDSAVVAGTYSAITTDDSSTITTFNQQGGFAAGIFSGTKQNGTSGNGASVQLPLETCAGTVERDGVTYGMVKAADGKCYLDRNLGATRVATAFNDSQSYGWLFQWGRGADGHQISTSTMTATLSSTDNPGHGNFITNGTPPYDWRSPQNTNLWQGVDGINNPCPTGFRLPTLSEWSAVVSASGITNSSTAASSALRLPVAGRRLNNGAIANQGSIAFYWSSSPKDTFAYNLNFDSIGVNRMTNYFGRSLGVPVRCVKDSYTPPLSSGTYTAYLDGGEVSPLWSSFRFNGTFPSETATVAFKIVGTNSTAAPSSETFDSATCSIGESSANSSLSFSDACATSLENQRYLWYRASFARNDTSETPTLDSVTAVADIFDPSGNATSASFTNIAFDIDAPSVQISSPSSSSKFNSITDSSDLSYSISNGPFNEDLQSAKLTFTRTAGAVDASSPRVCNLSGTELANGEHANVNLNEKCGGFSLVHGAVYSIDLEATDQAGNVANASQITAAEYDTVAPILLSFNSDTPNPVGAYGTGQAINIKAIYDEDLASGSTITVRLSNTANPATDIVLDQISGTSISGTYTIEGPNLGHDTADLSIASIQSENILDIVGNIKSSSTIPVNQNLSDNKQLVIDTGPPELNALSATAGEFKEGETITITAGYSETIADGSSITIRLNTSSGLERAEDIILSTINADKISGSYTVGAGHNAESLQVTSIQSQNAVDLIGNPLNGTTLPISNISGSQVDTTSPVINSPLVINSGDALTNTPTNSIDLNVSDNFGISDGFVEFSLNGGVSWCTQSAYSDPINFDITSATCGGSTANDVKTVTARITDKAGNQTIDSIGDSIQYDSLYPQLQKITADLASGIYGPTQNIVITATYEDSEDLAANSEIEVVLDSGLKVILSEVSTNTISGTYTVGATDSLEDSADLNVSSIFSHSASDKAGNVQTETSIAGITENIGTNKDIVIDTTAPVGTITIDRSASSSQILISATDTNSAAMQMEVLQLDSDSGACTFTDSWEVYATSKDLGENESLARKVCIKFKDQAGNISLIYSAITPETPKNITFTDITSLEVDPPFKGIFILWPNPTQQGSGGFARYELSYCSDVKTNPNCIPNLDLFDTSDININYYLHQNLSEESKYCYRLKNKDLFGNYSKYSDITCMIPSEGEALSNTAVSINDAIIGGETNSSAQFSFTTSDSNKLDTPLPTIASVEVYSDETLTTLVGTFTDSANSFGVSHVVKMTGLTSATAYYLKITATDSIDSTQTISYADNASLTFETTGSLSLITLPSQPTLITDDKAVVDFTTDQNSKCFLEVKQEAALDYGDYSPTSTESSSRKSHTITITGLLPLTSYFYRATCTDEINTPISAESAEVFITESELFTEAEFSATGDTTAPEITAVSIAEITGENATITWTTNEKANSLVAYQLEGTDFAKNAGDNNVNSKKENYSTAHSVVVNDLIPASKYLFYVISLDSSGNIAQSSESSFTTKEPSGLSSVKILSSALGQATVTWETGEDTSSIVEYGLTTSYGDEKTSAAKTKKHEVIITDLSPGQTYHLRVKGEDQDGNLYASNDMTFEPKSPPKISDFKIDEITEHTAKVTFITNVPTDAIVTYTDASSEKNSGFQGRPDFMTKHELELKNLESGVEFGIKLKVRDEDGNETEEIFENFQTSIDENPPKIEQVRTESALTQSDKVQAIISWKTNENANTSIVYKEGRAGKETEIKVSDVMTTSHIAVITTFKTGTVYYFNAKSIDASGNEAKSSDFALLTPKRKENIIQIIVNNFQEIFGWAQR